MAIKYFAIYLSILQLIVAALISRWRFTVQDMILFVYFVMELF